MNRGVAQFGRAPSLGGGCPRFKSLYPDFINTISCICPMKIFLDTAEVDVIKQYMETGLVDGVTTNPTLIMKSGRDPVQVIEEICKLSHPSGDLQSVSAEVMGDYDEMCRQAEVYANLFPEDMGEENAFPYETMTIKVPCTPDGLRVCKYVTEVLQKKVNVTLVFSVAQAILSAKAGAAYVSPFVGRCNDNSFSGVELIRAISGTFRTHGVKTEILAASLRDVHHVSRCFLYGADVVTMPPAVLDKMYNHVLTREGMQLFQEDYDKTLETYSPPSL